jgi:hypothetical protein
VVYWSQNGRLLSQATALREVRSMSESNTQLKEGTAGNSASVGTELKECVVCGAVGLPERITNHDCDDFLDNQDVDSVDCDSLSDLRTND